MKTIEWAAGLFEGEGCITTNHRIKIAMTDKDVVEDFARVVGFGDVREQQRPPHRTQYEWQAQRKSIVKDILLRMLPYFGTRRAYKALNCLDEIDNI